MLQKKQKYIKNGSFARVVRGNTALPRFLSLSVGLKKSIFGFRQKPKFEFEI
jgi:hypothetical protein